MEIIKRKILLENSIDRRDSSPTYGKLTATTFYINVMLTQNMDDMGMFTDALYLPNYPNNNTPVDYTILAQKLAYSGFSFPFMFGIIPTSAPIENYDIRPTGKTDSDFYRYNNKIISGITDSRKLDVETYDKNQPYKVGFDINTETYTNYLGQSVNGVTKVTSINPSAFTYVFDADKTDPNIGKITQTDGLVFREVGSAATSSFISYIGQGWNQTNISLSAITKEEYLLGIISKPEIESDVFIDRGISTVIERHLKLSEITNLNELLRYGRGYYNLNLQ